MSNFNQEVQFITGSDFTYFDFEADNKVTIYADNLLEAAYIDWDDNHGFSEIKDLFEKYSELSDKGEFLRGGITYKDIKTGDHKGFIYEVEEFNWEDRDYVIKGKILEDIEDGGEEDLDEIIGNNLQEKHNDFISSKRPYGSFSGGTEAAFLFDTLTIKEFQEQNPDDSFLTEYTDSDIAIGLNRSSNALIATNAQYDDAQAFEYRKDWKPDPFSWDYRKSVGSAEAYLTLTAQPKLNAYVNMPDSAWSWYDYVFSVLNPAYAAVKWFTSSGSGAGDIKVDIDLLLDWEATSGFKTGADDNGMIEIFNKDITLGGVPLFFGYFNGDLGAKANLKASVGATGLASDYQFKANQTLGIEIANTNKTGEYKLRNLSTSINVEKPTFDAIKDVKFNASITPEVNLKIGYVIPSSAPFFAGDSVLSINGGLTIPVTLDAKYDLASKNMDGSLKVEGFVNANAKAFEFLDGGWTFPIANTGFFKAQKDNIFA